MTTNDVETLLYRAKKYTHPQPKGNASDFANWIFRLSRGWGYNTYDHFEKIAPRKSMATPFVEADIRKVSEYLAKVRNDTSYIENWSLLYADNNKNFNKVFLASKLQVHGESLRCKPDAVLIHHPTNEILIIESKVMSPYKLQIEVPPTSYPNIRAQLFCYSQIDDWVDNPNITLMDDIWRRNKVSDFLSAPKYRRHWKHTDYLITQFKELFLIYSLL